ncbi:MAG: hypothetical protein PHW96_02295 [Candidatus Nanoarchaeia archaeon]|nr:hypothetical protein [Candidatus Nanoarchaeia archaeon]
MKPTHTKVENALEVVETVDDFNSSLHEFAKLVSELYVLRKKNKKIRRDLKQLFSKIDSAMASVLLHLPGGEGDVRGRPKKIPPKIKKLQQKVKMLEETAVKMEKKEEKPNVHKPKPVVKSKEKSKKEKLPKLEIIPADEKKEAKQEIKPQAKKEETPKEKPKEEKKENGTLEVPDIEREDEPMTKEAMEYINRIKKLRSEFEKIKEEI